MVIVVAAALFLGLLAVAAAVVWTAPARARPGEPDRAGHLLAEHSAGVRAELQRIDRLVTELRHASGEQHGSLVEQLRQVTATNTSLAANTEALRRALASPKQRGQWGERMADDVLAAAGFQEGVNYRRQRAIDGGTIPDFRFLLPHDLELRMDVKFPIDNYLRVLDAEHDPERARFTKAFVGDVRNRVKELAGRGYVDPRDTVDCVLLFIPNEAVYAFLHEADRDILDVALRHKVVLCSPATLFAVLAVVRHAVDQFRLERASDEILRCLGAVTDEWGRFSDTLDKVGRQLDTVTRSFCDELNGTRRRVFERTLGEVDRLRAPEPGHGLDAPGQRDGQRREIAAGPGRQTEGGADRPAQHLDSFRAQRVQDEVAVAPTLHQAG